MKPEIKTLFQRVADGEPIDNVFKGMSLNGFARLVFVNLLEQQNEIDQVKSLARRVLGKKIVVKWEHVRMQSNGTRRTRHCSKSFSSLADLYAFVRILEQRQNGELNFTVFTRGENVFENASRSRQGLDS